MFFHWAMLNLTMAFSRMLSFHSCLSLSVLKFGSQTVSQIVNALHVPFGTDFLTFCTFNKHSTTTATHNSNNSNARVILELFCHIVPLSFYYRVVFCCLSPCVYLSTFSSSMFVFILFIYFYYFDFLHFWASLKVAWCILHEIHLGYNS